MPRRARPVRQLDCDHDESSGSDGCLLRSSGAVRGDERIPGCAGDDDGVQLSEYGGGEHRLGLGDGQLVFLTIGQVPVAGGEDGVRVVCGPHGSPRSKPEVGPALTGEFGAANEGAGQLLPRRQPGVFDQRPCGGEPARVAGFPVDLEQPVQRVVLIRDIYPSTVVAM